MTTTAKLGSTTALTDDVIAVRVGNVVRLHGYTSNEYRGYCREVVSDMRRAGITADPTDLAFAPDGETTLETIRQCVAPDLSWVEFAAVLVILPCAADCIASPSARPSTRPRRPAMPADTNPAKCGHPAKDTVLADGKLWCTACATRIG